MPSLDPWSKRRAAGAPARPSLGAMNFGKRTPEPEAQRILARAVERGVELVDTANVYNDGLSEEIVGRFLRERQGSVLVATKVGLAGFLRGKGEGLSKATV